MDILGFLATAVLTQEWVVEQGVLKPLSNQRDSRELLPLAHEAIAQVTPVYQLDESTGEQFNSEQNQLRNRVEDLETRDRDLEVQHSPTAFLEGEVILGVSGVSGRDLDDSVVLQESIELTLNVSFTGEDLLEVGLESGSATEFPLLRNSHLKCGWASLLILIIASSSVSCLTSSPLMSGLVFHISTTSNDLSDFNPLSDRAERSRR